MSTSVLLEKENGVGGSGAEEWGENVDCKK
jgi:hypothetical protein